MKTTTFAILAAFAASTVFGQQISNQQAQRGLQTPEQRNNLHDLIGVEIRHENLLRNMANRANGGNFGLKSNAFTINCTSPVFVGNSNSPTVQGLCDPFNTGKALVRIDYFEMPADARPMALAASSDGFLFIADGSGSIYRTSDALSRGVADTNYVEYSGLAWSDRLLPLSGNDLLSEDGFRNRLFHYSLTSKGQATTMPAAELPSMGPGITSLVYAPTSRKMFGVNQYTDEVVAQGFSNGKFQGDLLHIFSGNRVNSIALDEPSGILFIQLAGDCNDFMPLPSVPSTQPVNTVCQPAQILALRTISSVFQNGPTLTTIAVGGNLDVYYSRNQFPMAVVGGKLLVTSLDHSDPNSPSQMILAYDYAKSLANGGTIEPTVFADKEILGEYAYINSLIAFKGGAVPLLQ